tara:strand:- start:12 stop:494 length:483 start_codon:yes stop_codon:yes gene_type:complete
MLINEIENIVKPVIYRNNCSLWGIEILRGKKKSTLRIYIDSIDGVDINDCEIISKDLNYEAELDILLGENFILEVSTPGIDRKFFYDHQLPSYIGQKFFVKTKKALNGIKKFEGTLIECENASIYLQFKEEKIKLNFNNLDVCKLKTDFNELIKENTHAK